MRSPAQVGGVIHSGLVRLPRGLEGSLANRTGCVFAEPPMIPHLATLTIGRLRNVLACWSNGNALWKYLAATHSVVLVWPLDSLLE